MLSLPTSLCLSKVWPLTQFFLFPRLAWCVAPGTTEIQGHHPVWCARRGGLRTPSTTADANLDCAFVENALITPVLDFETSTELELSE